jgi:hypothetical protein
MAIGVVMDFKGGTLEQYDQVMVKMGLDHATQMPEGGISHWVCATDDGIRVTDVWETREQYDKFAAEQIGPYTEEVGIPEPPQISFFGVHNYLIATPAEIAA